MSGTRTDQDLSQALTAWMHEVAPQRPPARLFEETFARTSRVAQVRVYPWQKVAFGSFGRRTARSGTVVLIVLVALVVVTMAIGLGGGGPPVTVPSTPSPDARRSDAPRGRPDRGLAR